MRSLPVGLPGAVIERLGHEQPAARVDAKGDRLHDIGLGGENRGAEAVGQDHRLGGLVGRKRARSSVGGERRERGNETNNQQPIVHVLLLQKNSQWHDDCSS